MKRIFISVGSQGTKALQELINHLRDENMLDKFNDYYIAFDTDRTVIKDFNDIGIRTENEKIKGYELQIEASDAVTMKFQPAWTWRQIGIGGVGGDRRKARKAAAFFRNTWENPGLNLNANLQSDDQIFVVGSAFGGTSGGMFVNVCQYLDYIINEKRQADNQYSGVLVHGFLLMPAANRNPNYSIASNMIDMFRNLQIASWQRRLETTRPGFKVPTLIQYQDGFFNLHKPGNLDDYGIRGSSLPMSTLYLIPTPEEQTCTLAVYAEALFAASYLAVCDGHQRYVDRFTNSSIETDITAEDKCISGFNMFAMRSGRTRSLKNCFYKKIMLAIRGENSTGGLHNDFADQTIKDNIKILFEKIQTPGKDSRYAGLELVQGRPLSNLIEALKKIASSKSLSDFNNNCLAALGAIESNMPSYKVLSAEGLITALGCSNGKWLDQITFRAIRDAYSAFYANVTTQINNLDSYKQAIQQAVDQACKMANKRSSKSNLSVRYLGIESPVFNEIIVELGKALTPLIKNFLFACRCKKTSFIEPDKFSSKMEEIMSESNALWESCEKELQKLENDDNPYIAAGQLKDNLELVPGVDFNPIAMIFSSCYRKFSPAEEDNNLVLEAIRELEGHSKLLRNPERSADQIVKQAEEQFIVDFIREANELPITANPLRDLTYTNFDPEKHKTHAPELRVPDSATYHHHFVIQLGDIPANFSMTNAHVRDKLQLSTMPNTNNDGESFWKMNHSGVQNPSSWSGNHPAKTSDVHGAGAGTMFAGKTANIDVQGLWLGTLGIDFNVRDTIRKIYDADDTIFTDWAKEALVPEGEELNKRRNEMSIVEMLKFGLIIEAIGDKFQTAWKNHKYSAPNDTILTCPKLCYVSFDKDGKNFQLSPRTPNNMGFIDTQANPSWIKFAEKWVGEIMEWIRSGGEDGFNSFFPKADFASVKQTDDNIFQHMRFSITKEEEKAMNNVKDAIMNSLQVQLI